MDVISNGYFLNWFIHCCLHSFKKKLTPIQQLSLQSKKVAEGNLELEPLPVTSTDEVGMLTQNFNSMIENLKMLLRVQRMCLNVFQTQPMFYL